MEYSIDGEVRRTIGALRPTLQEADREVHLALNKGLPLAHPDGGFSFVFQACEPRQAARRIRDVAVRDHDPRTGA